MRLGFFLPHIGPWAGPEAIALVGTRAEDLGFDSLWVKERSLLPLGPKTPYPLGDLPDVFKTVLDPLDTLAFIAGQTTRIALGTGIINLPWYRPVLLARRLTTIDVLSKGRLRAGLGIGWSEDEHDVAGSDFSSRSKRFEEAIQVLKTIWTTDPVEFDGEFYSVPRSFIGPKTVQKPHPPIYIGAFSPPALARVARVADGWVAIATPIPAMAETLESIRDQARKAGRDADSLQLIVAANIEVSEKPLGEDRFVYTGTPEQLAGDIAATEEIGAEQLIFDATLDPAMQSVDDVIERMELVMRLSKEALAGAST